MASVKYMARAGVKHFITFHSHLSRPDIKKSSSVSKTCPGLCGQKSRLKIQFRRQPKSMRTNFPPKDAILTKDSVSKTCPDLSYNLSYQITKSIRHTVTTRERHIGLVGNQSCFKGFVPSDASHFCYHLVSLRKYNIVFLSHFKCDNVL